MSPFTFDHLGIVATDPPITARFWASLLEGTVEPGPPLAVRAGGLHIAIDAGTPPASRGLHLALRVDALDPWIHRLDALGAPWERVADRLYALDPDRFVLELVPSTRP
ncbi:MAG: VOC family protein [Myxococcota bacterium]